MAAITAVAPCLTEPQRDSAALIREEIMQEMLLRTAQVILYVLGT